jgi:hypothetical protein
MPRPGNVPADEFDPERTLRVLADHGVDCLIVGGFGAQPTARTPRPSTSTSSRAAPTRTWSDSPPHCEISARAFEWAA